jgi:endonuclease-3
VHRRLRASQEPFVPKEQLPVVDELVATVLSQATSDINSGRAFASLKDRFASWDEVARAPVPDIANAIRSGGIAEVKSRRIKAILNEVAEREGAVDLRRLERMSDDEAMDYLCSLPGVGPKTAACVLMFSMGRDAFPVDTHVDRIAKRLGWVAPKLSAVKTQDLLSALIPPEIRYDLHLALVTHGRTICIAQRPRCSECPVFEMCESGPKLLAAGAAR